MKYFFLIIPILIVSSCRKEMVIVDTPIEIFKFKSSFSLIVDGVEDNYSFGCGNFPSIYRTRFRNEFDTGKNLIDQRLDSIPISSERELSYKLFFYATEDMRNLDIEDMKLFIEENPEIVSLEIALTEGGKTYQNQYFDGSNLAALYEDRNIVADNEEFSITTGDINSDCVVDRKLLELAIEYSGNLKTESEIDIKEISLSMQIQLLYWD